ncbi:hypothetical protein [Motilibacter deserti]|uniref:Uncharacterized protein n=1 Tax=Motilibacter deserti TaxID=2714956 RepID=A0ABX0GWC2_9ACTN|nr:hypothetical protein [Motilibacter deserti]NHC13934.1 hypothetical protein [Motilibacter deserti]
MSNVGELVAAHLPELTALAATHRLVDLAPAEGAEVSAELAPGATYADVHRFEQAAAALLGVPVAVVSKAAAAVPGAGATPDAPARQVVLPEGRVSAHG